MDKPKFKEDVYVQGFNENWEDAKAASVKQGKFFCGSDGHNVFKLTKSWDLSSKRVALEVVAKYDDLPNKPVEKIDKPRSKKDVFKRHKGVYFLSERMKEAYAQGYRFAVDTADNIWKINEKGQWIDNRGKLNGNLERHFGSYHDLPNTHKENEVSTVQEKTLDFVLSPIRSEPNRLMKILTDCNFFDEDGPVQCDILEGILQNGSEHGICDDGVNRFREHMGDLLPSKKTIFTIEVEFDGNVYEGLGESVARDIQKAVNEHQPFYYGGPIQTRFIKREVK